MREEGHDLVFHEKFIVVMIYILTVTPLCPPMTGTTTSLERERSPWISETKVEARTTSRVVTPKRLITNEDLYGVCSVLHSPLGVKDTKFLEYFSHNWDGRIDGVRDNKHESLRCGGRDSSSKILDDTSVDLDTKDEKK